MNRKNLRRLKAACATSFACQLCFAHVAQDILDQFEKPTDDEISVVLSAANPFNAKLVYQAMMRIMKPPVALVRYGMSRPPSSSHHLIADGIRKMEEEDFAGAIPPLTEATNLAPQSEEMLYLLGKSLLFAGRNKEAETIFKSSLRLVPLTSTTWTTLALSLANQGKRRDAISALVIAYECSENKQETLATFKNTADRAKSEELRPLYNSALAQIEHRRMELDLIRKELATYEADRKNAPLPNTSKAGNESAAYLKPCDMPDYPAPSRRKGEQGATLLALLIDTDGQVASAIVLNSSGYAKLDNAAQAAMWSCKFHPASKDGSVVKAWVRVPVVWKLE